MGKIEEANNKKQKKKRKRLLFRSILLAIMFGALLFAVISSLSGDSKQVEVGDQAPNFQLKQVNGENGGQAVTFEQFKGKGIMLNFWATWCPPCEAEMPYMQSLYPEYKEKGVEILAVSSDDTEKVIHDFIDKHDLTFPVLHDKKEEVFNQYGVLSYPTSLFINPEGEVVEIVEGPLTLERLEEYFQQIVPENG
ncbi:thiol-disulfide oxidoreductase ResA [Aquibacillus sediminis]|uniref:thiol-disulfide oxidoreductase ResA n=1 Tax=Aquibacillus sediminis TaxID=2574734 RepID=UPI00110A090E|nr:thiol-disulfide oxidoreductase ResA [Aquibacillus sediminis]